MEYEDTFNHDGHVYDLKKVRELLRSQPTFLLKTKDLLWVFDHDKPTEERVLKAKIRWPLIVAKYQGKWAVVDGLHRLERYRRAGIKVVPVKEANVEILDKCKIR